MNIGNEIDFGVNYSIWLDKWLTIILKGNQTSIIKISNSDQAHQQWFLWFYLMKTPATSELLVILCVFRGAEIRLHSVIRMYGHCEHVNWNNFFLWRRQSIVITGTSIIIHFCWAGSQSTMFPRKLVFNIFTHLSPLVLPWNFENWNYTEIFIRCEKYWMCHFSKRSKALCFGIWMFINLHKGKMAIRTP